MSVLNWTGWDVFVDQSYQLECVYAAPLTLGWADNVGCIQGMEEQAGRLGWVRGSWVGLGLHCLGWLCGVEGVGLGVVELRLVCSWVGFRVVQLGWVCSTWWGWVWGKGLGGGVRIGFGVVG